MQGTRDKHLYLHVLACVKPAVCWETPVVSEPESLNSLGKGALPSTPTLQQIAKHVYLNHTVQKHPYNPFGEQKATAGWDTA